MIELTAENKKRVGLYINNIHCDESVAVNEIVATYLDSNDYLKLVATKLFSKVESIKIAYSKESSIVVILDDPERVDRCSLYDTEESLRLALPLRSFNFYSTEGEANYSVWDIIYQRESNE